MLTAPGGGSIAGAVVTYTYANATTGKSLGSTPPTDVGSYTVDGQLRRVEQLQRGRTIAAAVQHHSGHSERDGQQYIEAFRHR